MAMKGWIYFASNPSLEGVLKIGFTERDPLKRLSELSNTSVPNNFVLIYAALIADAEMVEQLLHKKLQNMRVNNGREFFSCNAAEAKKHFDELISEKKLIVLYEEINFIFEEEEISQFDVTIKDAEAIPEKIISDHRDKFKNARRKYAANDAVVESLLDEEIHFLSVMNNVFGDYSYWRIYLSNDVDSYNSKFGNKAESIKMMKNLVIARLKKDIPYYPDLRAEIDEENKNKSPKSKEIRCPACFSSRVFFSPQGNQNHCQDCNNRFK